MTKTLSTEKINAAIGAIRDLLDLGLNKTQSGAYGGESEYARSLNEHACSIAKSLAEYVCAGLKPDAGCDDDESDDYL